MHYTWVPTDGVDMKNGLLRIITAAKKPAKVEKFNLQEKWVTKLQPTEAFWVE